MIDYPSEKEEDSPHLVYIKKDIINNCTVWTLHGEKGTLLALSNDKESLENSIDDRYKLVTTH